MRILVVDDEQSIRELLAFNLEKAGYEVLEAEDGEKALELAAADNINLILLDLMIPKVDGLEVCRRLKSNQTTAHIPVIMVTAKAEEIDKVLGLELGADDYVTKPFGVRELLSRVKAVTRRQGITLQQENCYKKGLLIVDFDAHRVFIQSQEMVLTPKEFDLLALFVTNEGKAFSRDELLAKVWGYEYYGDTRTVDVHIRNLRAKLQSLAGKIPLSDTLETVRGKGYRFNYKS